MNKSYFEQVYEKTHRSLIRYAIVHLDDPTDAEDALQNVYVDFYRRVERYGHFDILSPEAFLIRMLKHEIIENYKERERRRLRFVDEIREDRIPAEPFEDVVMDRALAHLCCITAMRCRCRRSRRSSASARKRSKAACSAQGTP